MALRALVKNSKAQTSGQSVVHLYRAMIKELPRVMTIYDIDMPLKQARSAVTYHFRKHGNLKDGRVVGLLLAKGYMELEETLMQWKQKTHLMRVLDPLELKTDAIQKLSSREKFILGIEEEDSEALV
jgi:NADH dehydrogenase (ubiquinone) 1 alpha subcomplex subunit 6